MAQQNRGLSMQQLLAFDREQFRELAVRDDDGLFGRMRRVLLADPDYRFPGGVATVGLIGNLEGRSTIDVFRACPRGSDLRPGDWIAVDMGYAQRHLRGDSDYMLSTTIDVTDLIWAGTDADEFIFAPRELARPDASSLHEAVHSLPPAQLQWAMGGRRPGLPTRERNAATEVLRLVGPALRGTFRLDWNHTHHGIAHWSRVWLNGRELARQYDINPMIPAWFAFLHDSQRHNENLDPGHGRRSAAFARSMASQGILRGLSSHELGLLCDAMEWHSEGGTHGPLAVQICWDADRLDLGRVGIYPDEQRLCTQHARQMIPAAYARSVGEKVSPLMEVEDWDADRTEDRQLRWR